MYILKFIGLALLFIAIVLIIFVVSPFLLALVEILVFHPDQNNRIWLSFLVIQTMVISCINILICESIRFKLFKNYQY